MVRFSMFPAAIVELVLNNGSILASGVAAALLAMVLNAPLAAQQNPTRSGTFKDCADCPTMVVVPGGTFLMGVPDAEDRANTAAPFLGQSAPQHRVNIKSAFALGAYAVTRGEFAAFVAATGYDANNSCAILSWGDVDNGGPVFFPKAGYSWRNPGFSQTDRDPVVCVNHQDIRAYVAWLSKKTGRRYRLPSEAEWEYAARAGQSGMRPWGANGNQACRYANVPDRTLNHALMAEGHTSGAFNCSDGFAYTSPEGSFPPNAFGLYDMLGNVAEPVEDCWHENYRGAPNDGTAWTDSCAAPRGVTDGVGRGGSWGNGLVTLRFGWRVSNGHAGPDDTGSIVDGFRVAASLEP